MPLAAQTFGQLIDELAARYPSHTALIWKDQRFTYADVKSHVERLAAGLTKLGIQKGDKVAVWSDNRPEWVFAFFAVPRIGGTVVPINTWYQEEELTYVLDHSDARCLILAPEVRGRSFLETLRRIAPRVGVTQVEVESNPRLPKLQFAICTGGSQETGLLSLDQVMDLGALAPPPYELACAGTEAVSGSDIAAILYTSGSTARPKGVQLRHSSLIRNAYDIGERHHLTEADKLYLGVPLFFTYGSCNGMLSVFSHGGGVVLHQHFQAHEALQLISGEGCTVYYGMPPMNLALLDHPERPHFDLSSLRTGFTGIGPVEHMRQVMTELGISQANNSFGMTEGCSINAMTDASDPLETRLTRNGMPMPGVEIRICTPETGERQQPGQEGEICLRGYNITPGYYKDPELTAQTFTADGFLRTGDRGYLDAQGQLVYLGRLKEMIKSGGINVSPLEVEQFLQNHPRIRQLYVVAGPDPIRTEAVVAFIETTDAQQITVEEIQEYCKERIASYKIPRHVFTVRHEDLPMTATGKVQRLRLRERAFQLIKSP